MKLTYKKQMMLCLGIILLFNVLTTVLKHWIFHSIGFVACGILWIVNPVLLPSAAATPKNIRATRIAGGILILIGIFTRAYYY